MDFDFTPDQQALREAIVRIVDDNRDLPRSGGVVEPRACHPATAMEQAFVQGGYLDLALEPGCGAVEAAILVYEAALSPLVMELGGAALVAPLLTGKALPRPVALARAEDLPRGVRFLAGARTVLVDCGDDVAVLDMTGREVAALESPFAYPLGRLTAAPDLTSAQRLPGKGGELRRLWRIALALEAAAAMEAAVRFTTDYVKQRQVFGRPVGSFQAVSHRCANMLLLVEGARSALYYAAWAADAEPERLAEVSALAKATASDAARQVTGDAIQAHGGIGFTWEADVHWLYKRAQTSAVWLGGAGAHRAALAAILRERAAGAV